MAVRSTCKSCVKLDYAVNRVYFRQYYKNNKEEYAVSNKQRYDANKPQAAAKAKQYYESNKDVFLYHLFILQILADAIEQDKLYQYHFAILRQLLEAISSFLGVGGFSYVLQQIGFNSDQTPEYAQIINNLSHENVYREQMSLLNLQNKKVIEKVFNALQQKYNFKFKV